MILLDGKKDFYAPVKLLNESSGEAKIYLCENQKAQNYVARISEGSEGICEEVRQFLYQNENPYILKLWDHGTVDFHEKKCAFEIYEYYPDGTWNLEAPVKPSIVEEELIPCLNEGLHAIHEAGLLHRDLKPDNIYVHKDEAGHYTAVIGDFGISVVRGSDGNYCDTALAYTPGYVPVEVLGGGMYSPASDYYALGVTIYYLLTGKQIFDGLTPEEIMVKTRRGEIAHYESLTKRQADLLEGLLIQDPRYRWNYIQVKEWIQGANVPVFRHTSEVNLLEPPYRLTGQMTCSSLKELAQGLVQYPEEGIHQLYEGVLAEGLRKQYPYLNKKLKEVVVDLWPRQKQAGLTAAAKLIDTEFAGICWDGESYAGLNDLLLMVRNELARGGISSKTEELVSSGILSYYYEENLSSEDAELLKQIETLAEKDVLKAASLLVLRFLPKPIYQIEEDIQIGSISEYISYLAQNRDHVASLLVRDLNRTYFQQFVSVCGYENQFNIWHSEYYQNGSIEADSHLVANVCGWLLGEICPEQSNDLKVFVMDDIKCSPEYWMKDHLDLYEMDEMMERMVQDNFEGVNLEAAESIQSLLKEQTLLKECMNELRRDLLNNYALLEEGIYDSAGYRILPLKRDGLFVADRNGTMVPVGWLRENQGLAGKELIRQGYETMRKEAEEYIKANVNQIKKWSDECKQLCEQKKEERLNPGIIGGIFSLLVSAGALLLLVSLSQKHLQDCGLITLIGFCLVFLATIFWLVAGFHRFVKVIMWNRLTHSDQKLLEIGEAMKKQGEQFTKEPSELMKPAKRNLETEAFVERAFSRNLLFSYRLKNNLIRSGIVFMLTCGVLGFGLVQDGALAGNGSDIKGKIVSLFDWDFLTHQGDSEEPEQKSNNFVVAVSVARMRSGPGTDYEVLNVYEEDTLMIPTGNQKEVDEYTWYEVTGPDDYVGWMRSDTIKKETE